MNDQDIILKEIFDIINEVEARKYHMDGEPFDDGYMLALKDIREAIKSEYYETVSRVPVRRKEKQSSDMMNLNNDDLVDVYVFYIGDYSLTGGVIDDENLEGNPENPSYWPMGWREEAYEVYLLHNVPVNIDLKLEAQGTSDQFYSDGYEAQNAAASFDGELVLNRGKLY